MKYRVFWSPEAELQLAGLLAAAGDQERLKAAVRQMDRSLAIDPFGFGESRADSIRIGFARPFAIQYDVLQDVATVIVYDLWRIDGKRGG